jgi:hypothetical protein
VLFVQNWFASLWSSPSYCFSGRAGLCLVAGFGGRVNVEETHLRMVFLGYCSYCSVLWVWSVSMACVLLSSLVAVFWSCPWNMPNVVLLSSSKNCCVSFVTSWSLPRSVHASFAAPSAFSFPASPV